MNFPEIPFTESQCVEGNIQYNIRSASDSKKGSNGTFNTTMSSSCRCDMPNVKECRKKLTCTYNKTTVENKNQQPFLLVVIFSTPTAFGHRNSSRNTWMKDFMNTTEVVVKFVIGLADIDVKTQSDIKEESENYGDLLLFPEHKEGYGPQCTEKLLITLKWASKHTEAIYLMKTDDDCYVRLGCILDILQTRSKLSEKPFLCGTIHQNAYPHKKGKWAEQNWKLSHQYLPFPFGSGYILPLSLVRSIIASNDLIPLRKLRNEDVTIGVWVASYDIDYINIRRQYVNADRTTLCPSDHTDVAIVHCPSPEAKYTTHNSCLSGNRKGCKPKVVLG
jgi:hypothetical protein